MGSNNQIIERRLIIIIHEIFYQKQNRSRARYKPQFFRHIFHRQLLKDFILRKKYYQKKIIKIYIHYQHISG
jgi:hypothetical protein